MLKLKWDQGDAETLDTLKDTQAVVDADWAKSHNLAVGDTMEFTTPAGKQVPYEIVGTFKNQAGLTANVIITAGSMAADWDVKTVAFAMAAGDPGVDPDELAATANKALKKFPSTEALLDRPVQEEAGRRGQPDPRPRVRPARPLGDRGAARDRQHARALGARAHA